jgi:membrane protein
MLHCRATGRCRAQRSGDEALLVCAGKQFIADDMPIYAAGLAFQTLFALFPFIIFLVTLLGFLNVPDFFAQLRQQAGLLLPTQAMAPVNQVIDEIQERHPGLLSVAILAALWSASGGSVRRCTP